MRGGVIGRAVDSDENSPHSTTKRRGRLEACATLRSASELAVTEDDTEVVPPLRGAGVEFFQSGGEVLGADGFADHHGYSRS